MEDILSSIKRIIAEEGDGNTPVRPRRMTGMRAVSAVPATDPHAEDDEILELSDPMPEPAVRPVATPAAQPETPAPEAEPIVSTETVQATRGSLDTLSRMMVKPEPPSDGTLEGLVRDMLRPVLREWIDANLPAMVETMVAREIARITGEPK